MNCRYVARPFARIGARSSRYVDAFILADLAATVTTGAKPHGQQQLARDLEVERAVMGYAASGKVGLVSVHLSRIQRLLQAVMNLSQLSESDARREEAQPTWCPQRRSPLVPSRTDSSNLHVI